MKPRPTSSSREVCRHLVIAVLLQVITAHPAPFRQFSSPPPPQPSPIDAWPPNPVQHFRPPTCTTPPTRDPRRHVNPVVSEKSRTPQPVFFPYPVPIPWPTPFNGEAFAPVPNATRIPLPVTSDLVNEYSSPFYIPVPQFEYVPFYYNAPPVPKPEPPVEKLPPLPQSPLPSLTESCPPQRSAIPKPSTPVAFSKSTPQSNKSQFPSGKSVYQNNGHPTERPIPIGSKTTLDTPCSQIRPTRLRKPGCAETPHSKRQPMSVVQPKRTPTSLYPTFNRSSKNKQNKNIDPISENQYPMKPSPPVPLPMHTWVPPPENLPDNIPPTPSILHPRSSTSHYTKTNSEDYVTYGPEVVTIPNEEQEILYGPEIFSHYYPEDYYPNPYDYTPSHHYPSQPPYVTYGPETITYSTPTRYDEGYAIYGPSTFTITEDAPLHPPHHSQPYRVHPPPRLSSKPTIPQPLVIGGRSSAPIPESPEPETQLEQEENGYMLYAPETFTIVGDDNDGNERFIVYGPNSHTVHEEPLAAEAQVGEDPATDFVEEQPGYYKFTEPHKEFFQGSSIDTPKTSV